MDKSKKLGTASDELIYDVDGVGGPDMVIIAQSLFATEMW